MTEPASVTAPSSYVVKLPLFEGPLDLLLHLIEKQELDITAISLARVADQFIAYLEDLRDVQAGVIADFLVVAARLLLIKSRWLLPKPVTDDDEEEDPSEALLRRLREYKRFRQAITFLKDRENGGQRAHIRVAPPPTLEARLDPGEFSLDDLLSAVRQILGAEAELLQPPDALISPRKVTVREKIQVIEDLISGGRMVPFAHVLEDESSRIEIVVSFWAVLELIKRGRVQARQSELFGEILLSEREGAMMGQTDSDTLEGD